MAVLWNGLSEGQPGPSPSGTRIYGVPHQAKLGEAMQGLVIPRSRILDPESGGSCVRDPRAGILGMKPRQSLGSCGTCPAVACGCTPDDLTAGCSDFTAVSKLPLVHCPVRGSRYDTGCASGRKRQPSSESMAADTQMLTLTQAVCSRQPALPRSWPALASLPFIVSDLDKRDENRMLTKPNRRMCPGHKEVPQARRAPCNRKEQSWSRRRVTVE